MQNIKIIILALLINILFTYFNIQAESIDSSNIEPTNIWIPSKSKQLRHTNLKASYQLEFEVYICFPAKEMIHEMVYEMKKQGWKRMEHDFLNPSIKLNHSRGDGIWSHIKENNNIDKYQWIEDWRNKNGDIARYHMSYLGKDNSSSKEMCNMSLTIIYIKNVLQPEG